MPSCGNSVWTTEFSNQKTTEDILSPGTREIQREYDGQIQILSLQPEELGKYGNIQQTADSQSTIICIIDT